MEENLIRTVSAPCPGCHNDIILDRMPKLGSFVTCPTCGDLVEVISLSPLTLDWSLDIDDDVWPEYEDNFGDSEDFRDDYADDYASDFDEEFTD